MDLRALIPAAWRRYVDDCDAVDQVERFLDVETRAGRRWQPGPQQMFRALGLCAPEQVRAVIVGQDPYPTPGVPTGLAFSVGPDDPLPASLRNVLREYSDDLGVPVPGHGDLTAWAHNGVLLLNTVLTCRAGEAASHARSGWSEVTSTLLQRLAGDRDGLVFLAWGKPAQKLVGRLPVDGHAVVECVHPSPLAAYRGWFGSRPFSRCNSELERMGRPPVDWRLP